MHGWGSRGTPLPLYAPHTREVGVPGWNHPKNLPALEDHLRAKFRPNPSSHLDFYREQTDIIYPEVDLDPGEKKNSSIINICVGAYSMWSCTG